MKLFITGVKLDATNKEYWFSCNGEYIPGDKVVISTQRGDEIGEVSIPKKEIDSSEITEQLFPILRIATKQDLEKLKENQKLSRLLLEDIKIIVGQELPEVKVAAVDYNLDRSKLIISFTSDERVDFRDLIKKLVSKFKVKIELRQIGARDEAKMLGGIGPCGQECCCTRFLNDFGKVSIKMAKNQNLSLNPTKISGLCGKLMCCLSYENEFYSDMQNKMPNLNSEVITPNGRGVVVYNDLLKEKVSVKIFDNDDSFTVKEFDLKDIKLKPKFDNKQN